MIIRLDKSFNNLLTTIPFLYYSLICYYNLRKSNIIEQKRAQKKAANVKTYVDLVNIPIMIIGIKIAKFYDINSFRAMTNFENFIFLYEITIIYFA
jgi:hypothetical protein